MSTFWKDRQVVVTGADGFIGSHLVERLAESGARVRALALYNSFGSQGWLDALPPDVRASVEIVAGDVRDADVALSISRGADTVFHLAALIAIPYSYFAPESYVQTNVSGTVNMLRAARTAGVRRFVQTSTSEVYGTAQYTPIDERHPVVGQSPYSASKIGADMMAMSFHKSFELPVTICRPFNTYGPRQSARAVIPTIVSQLVAGLPELRLGSLSPQRDLTFVFDTANGFLALAESEKTVGETVNLGTGRMVTVGDIAAMACKLTGRNVPIVEEAVRLRPEGSEVWTLLCDNRKALELAGWAPEWTFERGLERVVEFVAANLSSYRTDVYQV